MQVEQAMKALWAALLEYGIVLTDNPNANQWRLLYDSWNQYSGQFEGRAPNVAIPLENLGANINWKETTLPFYDTVSEFNDTDSPGTSIECMVGKLVLNNGSVFWLGTTCITNMMRHHKEFLDELPEKSGVPEEDLISKWKL